MTTYEAPVWREWHGTHKVEEVRVAAIKFKAEVAKVQTTTDGGIRLTLDLPEDGREVMADLANCQQNGVYLTIVAYSTIEAIKTI